MNLINIQQTGGFPLETDTIDRLQTNVLLMQAFGEAFGNFGIVKGATTIGTTVSDGVVYINGELLEFRGGQEGLNVIVVEQVENRVFEDGTSKGVFKTRYATFGTATISYPWANFVSFISLSELKKMRRVKGEIMDWFGDPTEVPEGWKICDGTNGTPDLRGFFRVGYDPNDIDYNTVGKFGGAKTVMLTESQMPTHAHTASLAAAGAHTHNIALKGGESDGGNSGRELRQNSELGIPKTVTTDSQGSHTHTITINNTGAGLAHENRPPYKVAVFIIWGY